MLFFKKKSTHLKYTFQEPIQEEFHNPTVPESHFYKKERKKNIFNVLFLKKNPTTPETYLPKAFQEKFHVLRFPERCSYKKKKRRTLVMFFLKEKPTTTETYLLWAVPRVIPCSKYSRSYKKRNKKEHWKCYF